MEMRFFWVADQVQRNLFDVHWYPGKENLADYFTKHFDAKHHIAVRPYYLHMPNSPQFLPRAAAPRLLRGCVGTLEDGYVKDNPLPRVPARKHTSEPSKSFNNYVIAPGGKGSLNKPELVPLAEQYAFINDQAPKSLVDRNPNPNGLMYANINASGERSVREILEDALQAASREEEDKSTRDLIIETYNIFQEGLFEDKYNNIALTAPELTEGLIYKSSAYIGSSTNSKNIGDAFKRCLYNNETASYHAIAFVPNTNKVIILSKAHASMARDEKTRNKTAKYEPPKKQQYLVIQEMFYRETNDIEHNHSLGVFVEIGRSYCGGCIAGQGQCRHRTERLWHQYHHWTDERLGVDRPPTLDACSWAPGGRKLASDVHLKIHQLQTVKHEKTIEAQKKKMELNRQTNSTEGRSGAYQPHLGDRKQNPDSNLQFTMDRVHAFFESLRK